MTYVPDVLRQEVIRRAENRCEYCGLAQHGQTAMFHIDHIRPSHVNGPTSSENLALACPTCSLRKNARISAIDPESGDPTSLYHPRLDCYAEHFIVRGAMIFGRTAVARATIAALRLNEGTLMIAREWQMLLGEYPPSTAWTQKRD